MHWLITEDLKERLEASREHTANPSAFSEFMAGAYDFSASVGTNQKTEKVGIIPVKGVLTQERDFWAWLCGGGNTTYSSIIASIQEFNADPKIDSITLDIDSPGGQVAGLFDVFTAIENSGKPVDTHVNGMAASAAYGLAAQGRNVTASSIASMVGSVGVVQSFYVDDSVVDVTSREAPNKRKDASTEEGVSAIQDELDGIHNLFAGAIAKGRGTTAEDVNKNFGRGGMLLASEAVDKGMIDCIADGTFNIEPSQSKSASAVNEPNPVLENKMDLKELKAQHRDVYEAALKEGVDQTMDNVVAHLTMGKEFNCMDVAIEAIKEGKPMTATLTAQYMTAGKNAQTQSERQEDDSQAAAALENAQASATSSDSDKLDDEIWAVITNGGE